MVQSKGLEIKKWRDVWKITLQNFYMRWVSLKE